MPPDLMAAFIAINTANVAKYASKRDSNDAYTYDGDVRDILILLTLQKCLHRAKRLFYESRALEQSANVRKRNEVETAVKSQVQTNNRSIISGHRRKMRFELHMSSGNSNNSNCVSSCTVDRCAATSFIWLRFERSSLVARHRSIDYTWCLYMTS